MTLTVVATTLAAYVMDDPDTYGAWLYTAGDMVASEFLLDNDVRFFAALEVDGRGIEPFAPLVERLNSDLLAAYWTYSLDDGRREVTTMNRQRHLTMGENLCSEYATTVGADHMLFMAADCAPPGDAINRLREVGWPIVGGHVSTYCLDGPRVPDAVALERDRGQWRDMDVRDHMPTAAFVLIQREHFKRARWRYDPDLGLTDDPAYYHDAATLFQYNPPAVVRHDVVGTHYPESIGPIEGRGHDMKVVW